MKGQVIGYIRVSSADQNTERQLEGIMLDIVFTDKASGKDTNRPQLQAAFKHARLGDTFVVHSMDRLARNCEDMLRVVRSLTGRGIAVQFLKEKMYFEAGTDDPRTTLLFTLLSAFSEFERAIIRERQREGIAIAKAKGNIYKGRKPALNKEQIAEVRHLVANGAVKAQVARDYKVTTVTLNKYIRSQ